MLRHFRLSHPNFLYLKKLFSPLFNKEPKHVQCEIYQLAKHNRNPYPIQQYKTSKSISTIHNDI